VIGDYYVIVRKVVERDFGTSSLAMSSALRICWVSLFARGMTRSFDPANLRALPAKGVVLFDLVTVPVEFGDEKLDSAHLIAPPR
jgi:Zn-dependent membrane protease YugP